MSCRSKAESIAITHCSGYSSLLLKEAIHPHGVPYYNSYSSSRLVHCYITVPQVSDSFSSHTGVHFRSLLACANDSAGVRTQSLESKWTTLEKGECYAVGGSGEAPLKVSPLILLLFFFLAIFILSQCY